ncbi:MAG: AAA family ATPase [Pseudomonadales bacterium]
MSVPEGFPESWRALLGAGAYPHSCTVIELIETHISWVLLTGEFAYKLKKPVRFAFVDFSTLARREHFCREELRCNRRFAPSLYVDVVKVVADGDRGVHMDGPGEALEWAVKMRQFPAEAQLDRLLERDALDADLLEGFGRTLADQHGALPSRNLGADALQSRVLAPVTENFDDIEALAWTTPYAELLHRCRAASEAQAQRQIETLRRRLGDGWIRECHGDLHLSNLVLLDDGVAAFDCLEFNPVLRWIDPQSDVAFLFMDCLVRDRADLAYAFLDGYLDRSGDYDGVRLLPFYAAYRSMVRAKVAALRRSQAEAGSTLAQALEARFAGHARWAADWLRRPPGRLLLTCGLSGSGKSFLARRLAPRLPALRLRSDVARKALAGLSPDRGAAAAVGEGLYAAGRTEAVYDWLAALAEDLLRSGEHVIVDATFLDPRRRARFLGLARALGSDGVVLYCVAPEAVLRARLHDRAASGDPSDADLAVLEHQQQTFEPPDADAVRVDTTVSVDDAFLDDLTKTLLGR